MVENAYDVGLAQLEPALIVASDSSPAIMVPNDLSNDRDIPLILVVDDHEDSRRIACAIIEFNGYRTVEAANGIEALAQVRACLPDLVLLDLRMPELDGWEVARTLRDDPATADLAVIAFTACVRPVDRDLALAAGCREVITKPVSPSKLLAAIRVSVRATQRLGRMSPRLRPIEA